MTTENFWSTFREYVRALKLKKTFTRTDLKEAMKVPLGRRTSNEITMDNYRNYLTQAGYLAKGEKRGTYIKLKQLPKNITVSTVLREAYPHNYQ